MAEHFLYILGHDGVHLCQILIELADIPLGPSIEIQLLRLLDEGVYTDKPSNSCGLIIK